MSCLSRGEGKKKKGRAGVAHARTVSSIVVVESKKEDSKDPLIEEQNKKNNGEGTSEEVSAIVGGETPMLNFPASILNATTTGSACMSTFYISLTSEGRRAMAGDAARGVEPMPAFFMTQPCEDSFAQAYEFFGRPGIPAAQRGVAKRWILEHLRDVEYALQSVEWERFPLARRYYQGRVVGLDKEGTGEEEEGGKRGRVMKVGEMIDVSADEMEEGMRVSTPPPPPLVIDGAATGRRAVRFDDADDADEEEGFERL